jgi:hypothetical protein
MKLLLHPNHPFGIGRLSRWDKEPQRLYFHRARESRFGSSALLYTRPKSLRQLVGYASACPRPRAAERRAVRVARVAGKLKHTPPLMGG